MTTASSRPGMITKPVEVHARGGTAERVFVSPRVVDEQAFREFSTELRALIDEVRSTQNELAAAGADASTTAKDLSDSQGKYRKHLELTTKLLKALTAKSAEVEKSLEQIDTRLQRAQNIERSAADTMDKRMGVFERSLDERLARLEASYDRRLNELEAGFEEKRARLAAEWEDHETEVRERIESHREFLRTGAASQADEIEAMLRERAAGLSDELVGKLNAAQQGAEAAMTKLDAQRAEFAGETGESLENTLEQLRSACAIATKLVGWDPADPGSDPDQPTEGSLGELVRRASKAREDAEWSVRRLSSVRDQSQAMVAELGESLDGSLALFDQLHAQRGKLDSEIVAILDRAEASSAELKARQAEIEGLVSPLSETLARAEAVTRDLSGMADGAADLLAHAGAVQGDLDAVLVAARDLTRKLEPWRETILEASGTSELPAALTAIVERFEEEIGRDLAKMASAMQTMAQRAEAAFRAPGVPGTEAAE